MKNILALIILVSVFISCTKTEEEYKPVSGRVPEWSKTVVWYQIFPDRFYNGDTSNDPKIIDRLGGWPYDYPEYLPTHPWTSDWYKLQPWEEKTGKDFYYVVQMRRYGGDIKGIMQKLNYLQELGVTGIYLNPMFEAPSLHKYDATNYIHIDDNFGPDPQGDKKIVAKENKTDPNSWQWTSADKLFLELIKECHKRNIKIIIDGVFNHVGRTHWAFEDVKKNGENSPFKEWFYINSFDDPETDEDEFDYEGWYGVKELPELREDENGLVEPVANHIHNVVKRWMDPNGDGNPEDGIDGWRLDVADMVNINFWKKFRTWVKGINPDAYITGEIWWDNYDNDVMHNAAPWLQGDVFDGVMNYRFMRAAKMFVANKTDKLTPGEFIDSLNNIYNDYNPENVRAVMNLIGSHDTERFATLLKNPQYYIDHLGNLRENPDLDVEKPSEEDYKKLKLVAGLQATLPGAPMIYYGDEAGMWGADDPDERKPMVWQEFNYENETTNPINHKTKNDVVKFNHDLFNWYKTVFNIRKEHKALAFAPVKVLYKSENAGIIAFERKYNNEAIYVILNNSEKENKLTLEAEELGRNNILTDLTNNRHITFSGGNFKFNLQPYELIILK